MFFGSIKRPFCQKVQDDWRGINLQPAVLQSERQERIEGTGDNLMVVLDVLDFITMS